MIRKTTTLASSSLTSFSISRRHLSIAIAPFKMRHAKVLDPSVDLVPAQVSRVELWIVRGERERGN